MMKTTQKDIRNLVNYKQATELTAEMYNEVMEKESYLVQIAYSCGVYGCNAKLFKGKNTGALYAVTARNNALFAY